MSEPDRRFVVLHHVTHEGEHWDLMLEMGETLATWQLQEHPERAVPEGSRVPARRLSDHRLAYLEYEGEISGGRGTVRRIDEGMYQLLARSRTEWLLRMKGRILDNVFVVTALQEGEEGMFGRAPFLTAG